jgi:hypothetical protein
VIEAERDAGLRSTVLQWADRVYEKGPKWQMGKELYVPDSEWGEFVALVNGLDAEKKAQQRAIEIIRERDAQKA